VWPERPLGLLLAAAGAAFLVGLGILLDRQLRGPQPLELVTDNAGEIKVYVTGAVASPGVYTFREGDRVIDAIAAAGGPTEEADLAQINLARRLRDEDHIIVPARGQKASPQQRLININTASAELLATLPGIGEIRSRNIVASRERDGPFLRTEELVERGLIPQAVYEQIKGLITTGP